MSAHDKVLHALAALDACLLDARPTTTVSEDVAHERFRDLLAHVSPLRDEAVALLHKLPDAFFTCEVEGWPVALGLVLDKLFALYASILRAGLVRTGGVA